MQRATILVNQIIERELDFGEVSWIYDVFSENNEQHVYIRYVDTGECRWANIAELRMLPDVDKAVK